MDEDRIIQGDGGVIYVDYDVVIADYNIIDKDPEHYETEQDIDNVIDHNDKLVGVIKNTLEMQSFLFDKLLNYFFK